MIVSSSTASLKLYEKNQLILLIDQIETKPLLMSVYGLFDFDASILMTVSYKKALSVFFF